MKYQRKDYSLGWVPDADSVNGPVNGLLRADNCVLSEAGVLAKRLGSSKVNSAAFEETNVDNVYSCYLKYGSSTNRYRVRVASTSRSIAPYHSTAYHMWLAGAHRNIGGHVVDGITTANNGAGLVRVTSPWPHDLVTGDKVSIYDHSVTGYNAVWTVTRISTTQFDLDGSTYSSNGTGGGFELSFGQGKIHMIDYMDRLFMCSDSVKKKWDQSYNVSIVEYDPKNVFPWGVEMTGTKPTVASRSTDNSVTIDNCATAANWDASARELVTGEYLSAASGPNNTLAGYEGTASQATLIVPATTGRGVITRIFDAGANTTTDFQYWTLTPSAVKKTTDSGANYTDYTSEATDGNLTTDVPMSNFGTLANNTWLLVGSHQKFSKIVVTMDGTNQNGTGSVLSVQYSNDGTTWYTLQNISDGTASGGATFAQTGTITFTEPTGWEQTTIDGQTLYFVRLVVSVALDASTDINEVSLRTDGLRHNAFLDFYLYAENPQAIKTIDILVDCNPTTLQGSDHYLFRDNYYSSRIYERGKTAAEDPR